ncbi:MAG TPA: NAD kinase [Bacteroidales bacterium]|nr:NAD kinase [Bacteroidales bacterium]HQI71334.1 NAD kinase [Bacteroidales bacterium]
MKIALFATTYSAEQESFYIEFIGKLIYNKFDISIYKPLHESLLANHLINADINTFCCYDDLKGKTDFLFSVGGDGTMLKTLFLVRDSGIPILGFNTGRLGFLSAISKDEISEAIESLKEKKFHIEKRSLIRLEQPEKLFGRDNFALNEITIHKKDSSSMITIQAFVNDVFLNSYWADGLIVCTPTGSTAYSLSCGGPIIAPDAKNFILTPVATHNLTVRPMVIPDNAVVKLKVEGRTDNFLVTLDSNNAVISNAIELIIKKEDFGINLVQLNSKSFFSTIRDKLMWGWDKRN